VEFTTARTRRIRKREAPNNFRGIFSSRGEKNAEAAVNIYERCTRSVREMPIASLGFCDVMNTNWFRLEKRCCTCGGKFRRTTCLPLLS